MKRVAIILAVLGGVPAQAGTLTCHFTEPFFSITFDSATGLVVMTSADEVDSDTGEPVPRTIAENAKLVAADQQDSKALLQAGGKTILELAMEQGSDGMSELVYPMGGTYERYVGGCETDKVPAFNLYDLFQDLGLNP